MGAPINVSQKKIRLHQVPKTRDYGPYSSMNSEVKLSLHIRTQSDQSSRFAQDCRHRNKKKKRYDSIVSILSRICSYGRAICVRVCVDVCACEYN